MISNTYANKVLNLICGITDGLSLPSKLYLGLSSSAPDSSTGEVTGEPTANSYARVVVGGSTAESKKFGNAAGGVIKNAAEIQFLTAREAWGEMTYFFLSESPTGNAILWGEIPNGITVQAETVPVLYENDLQISLDVPLS